MLRIKLQIKPQFAPVLALLASAAPLAQPAIAQDTLIALRNPTAPALYEVDVTTGAEGIIGFVSGAQAIFCGLTFDDGGNLYSIDGFNDAFSDRLFRIDPTTAAGAVVGDTGENWNFRSIAFDPTTGTLYAARDNRLYTADRATGAVTLVGNITGPNLDQLTAIAINDDGECYGSDIDATSIFRIDLATGNADFIGNVYAPGVRNWFNDLAFDADGTLWAAQQQGGGLYTVDLTTGAATRRFSTPTYQSIAFERTDEPCYADFDGDGELTIFDFLAFQNAFDAGADAADCDGDGSLTLFDFLCFQNAFDAGCE